MNKMKSFLNPCHGNETIPSPYLASNPHATAQSWSSKDASNSLPPSMAKVGVEVEGCQVSSTGLAYTPEVGQ